MDPTFQMEINDWALLVHLRLAERFQSLDENPLLEQTVIPLKMPHVLPKVITIIPFYTIQQAAISLMEDSDKL